MLKMFRRDVLLVDLQDDGADGGGAMGGINSQSWTSLTGQYPVKKLGAVSVWKRLESEAART